MSDVALFRRHKDEIAEPPPPIDPVRDAMVRGLIDELHQTIDRLNSLTQPILQQPREGKGDG